MSAKMSGQNSEIKEFFRLEFFSWTVKWLFVVFGHLKLLFFRGRKKSVGGASKIIEIHIF